MPDYKLTVAHTTPGSQYTHQVPVIFQKVYCICSLGCSPCTSPLILVLFQFGAPCTGPLRAPLSFRAAAPSQYPYAGSSRSVATAGLVGRQTLRLPRADHNIAPLSNI